MTRVAQLQSRRPSPSQHEKHPYYPTNEKTIQSLRQATKDHKSHRKIGIQIGMPGILEKGRDPSGI